VPRRGPRHGGLICPPRSVLPTSAIHCIVFLLLSVLTRPWLLWLRICLRRIILEYLPYVHLSHLPFNQPAHDSDLLPFQVITAAEWLAIRYNTGW
jgi:hypothetical protein